MPDAASLRRLSFTIAMSMVILAQWANIKNTQGSMFFEGSLSQNCACSQVDPNPTPTDGKSCYGLNEGPDTSWQQLNTAVGQAPTFSDNIGYS